MPKQLTSVPPTSSSDYVLQTLAWLRKHSFRPVPLRFQSKAALSPDFAKPDYDPPDAQWRNANLGIGVLTGFSRNGPIDIDLDCDEALALAPRFLPPTPAVFGRKSKRSSHYLYQVNAPMDKVAYLDPVEKATIIEIRADGGHQTVLPGSLHEGTGELVGWESTPFPDVAQVEPSVITLAVKKIAIAVLIIRHLWHDGQRNEMLKHLTGMLFYLDWPEEDTRSLVEAVMDYTGDTDRTRLSTVSLTYRRGAKGTKITGATTLRRQLKDDSVVDRLLDLAGSPTVNLLQDYNERFAVVSVEGKFRVADLDVPPSEPPMFMLKEDFINFYGTDYATIDDKQIPKPKLWLTNPRRRSYRTVDFLPGEDDNYRVLNLWTGFAVQPVKGDCTGWLALLRDIICGNNDELARWLLHWFANIVREPRSKPLTAPVIIGTQGAGKSLLFKYFAQILGSAYTHVSNEEHIYGKFNRHLATTLLLHSDEALYGGEKKHRGIIKSLIADEYRIFEQKGIDARQVRNYLRLALTSNEAHAAPAEPNDRRFTVIDMGDRMIDKELVKKVVDELNGTGPAALFDFLLEMNYDPAIPRTNVKNEALQVLKSINASPLESWWLDRLQTGVMLPDFLAWAQKPENADWPTVVSGPGLYMSMVLYFKDRNLRQIPNETSFVMQLRKYTRSEFRRGQRSFVNPMSDDAPREVRNMSPRQNAILDFPNLKDSRRAFIKHIGQVLKWPEDLPDSDKGAHQK